MKKVKYKFGKEIQTRYLYSKEELLNKLSHDYYRNRTIENLKNKYNLTQTDSKNKYDLFIKYLSENLDNRMYLCIEINNILFNFENGYDILKRLKKNNLLKNILND